MSVRFCGYSRTGTVLAGRTVTARHTAAASAAAAYQEGSSESRRSFRCPFASWRTRRGTSRLRPTKTPSPRGFRWPADLLDTGSSVAGRWVGNEHAGLRASGEGGVRVVRWVGLCVRVSVCTSECP